MKYARVLGPFTFNLFVVSVISHRQDKQWLWEIPEVELKWASGFRTIAMAAVTHHKKYCHGMDVFCRLERKWIFTFEPAPQLNPNSHQPFSWSFR